MHYTTLLLCVLLVVCVQSSKEIVFKGRQLYVNGEKFAIRGVCYSPVPIGESPSFSPNGDYFTSKYAYIWSRDLPSIKAMGANTIRIYGWNRNSDHTHFLDYVASLDMYVFVTYYVGTAKESPVNNATARQAVVTNFATEVKKYSTHDAILMWSFGNELNGPWNGFMDQLNIAYSCKWVPPCTLNSDPNSTCVAKSDCLYDALFTWLNDAAKAAKEVSAKPVITGFADVDYIIGSTTTAAAVDRLTRSEPMAPDIAAWGMQLYRGNTFSNAFERFLEDSEKALVVTEYGVDAYNDPCRWPENLGRQMCMNSVGDGIGGADLLVNGTYVGCHDKANSCSQPGVLTQADWDGNLTRLILAASPSAGGAVVGSFVMAWVDEYWKNAAVQNMCNHPCPHADIETCRTLNYSYYDLGGGAGCRQFSHISCGDYDSNYHDLCGYMIGSAPDQYCNEAWFGLNAPASCNVSTGDGYHLDAITMRPIAVRMMEMWGVDAVRDVSVSCDAQLPCYKCVMGHTEAEIAGGKVCDVDCFGGVLPPSPSGGGGNKSSTVYYIIGGCCAGVCLIMIGCFVIFRCKQRQLSGYTAM